MLEKILRQLQLDQEQLEPIDARARLAEIFDALRPGSIDHTDPLKKARYSLASAAIFSTCIARINFTILPTTTRCFVIC